LLDYSDIGLTVTFLKKAHNNIFLTFQLTGIARLSLLASQLFSPAVMQNSIWRNTRKLLFSLKFDTRLRESWG
jgi:hypothetical protein